MSSIAKITTAQGADEALDRMVKAANDGFSGGRVTKHDLTSWIITHFEEDYFQLCISKIREDHFNQITYLEGVVKELRKRESGDLPVDIAELLAPVLSRGTAPRQKKGKGTSRKEETSEAPDQKALDSHIS